MFSVFISGTRIQPTKHMRVCFALCNNLQPKKKKKCWYTPLFYHFSRKTSDVFYCGLLFIHIYLMSGFIDFFFLLKAHKVYGMDLD